MVNSKHKPVQSLLRGLTMLETLANRRDGVALKELAEAITTSPPAAYHMIQTLVEAGYAERKEHRYFLGSRLAELVHRNERHHLKEATDILMVALAEKLPGASVYCSDGVGENVMVVGQILSAQPRTIQSGHSYILPPYVSCGGLIYLAYWPQEMVDRYCERHPFEHYGLPFWRTRDAFDAAIGQLRRDSYFLMPESSPSRLKLALPLLHRDGGLLTAITVQWNHPEDCADLEALRRRLVATALNEVAAFSERL